jgi:DNA-binding CsgD family transcriptional regulator
LLTAWLEGLKRQGLGFKFANPNVYKTPDGTGTVRYLTGEIRGLCEVSANFCKTLESRALQSEFERKKHDQESVKALASRQFEAIKRTLELRSERKEQTPEALAVDALPQLEPTEKGMPTKKVRKKYPRGFNGLQGKHADMSGYLALVDLTPRQRECYSLRKEYNLPLTEVAARLGIDRKTAYEHINQAEKRMRLQLEKRRDRSGRIKIPRIAE